MSKPIYRAFLNDIVQCFFDEGPDVWLDGSSEGQQRAWAAVENAKAALDATPPPEPPTDDELLALKEKLWDKYKTIPYQGEEFMYGDAFESALSDYRAALERWGHR